MTTTTRHVLRVERTFSATRDRVFAAWTEPELMRQWTPDGIRIGEAEMELRVGGRYRTEMIGDDGSRYVVVGRYLEIEPPSRLRFTHGWLNEGEEPEDVDARATEVTVELHDEGPRTRMVFTQTGFPDAASRDGHEEGWGQAFRDLDRLLDGGTDRGAAG